MHKDQIFTYTKYTQHFVFILFIFYMVVSNDLNVFTERKIFVHSETV